MKNYPVKRRPDGRGHPVIPYNTPRLNIPASIIPKFCKDHNIAGQVSTRIHLKNARGEEMTIYQNQQLLNLMKGCQGNWHVSDGGSRRYKRSNKK